MFPNVRPLHKLDPEEQFQHALAINRLNTYLNTAVEPLVSAMTAGEAPTVAEGTALMWVASGAGTKDGQSYAQGDVLVTSDVGGTSKTTLLLDWSAL